MHTQTENPPLSTLLRLSLFAEFVVLIAAGTGLFFAPAFTQSIWPWTLTPFNTGFLGAIYLGAASVVLFTVVLGRWVPAQGVLIVVFVFTFIVLIVSLLYISQFDFQRWGTWLWFALYVALPLNAAYHLWSNRHLSTAGQSAAPNVWRIILLVVGAALILYGAGLMLLPATFSGFWPWQLDDFHARLYSSTFVGGGVGLLLLMRNFSALALIAAGMTQAVTGALALIGLWMVNARVDRIDTANTGFWLWLLLFLGMFGFGAVISIIGLRMSRQ